MDEEFKCGVDWKYRSACKDLPRHQGTSYCVLHYPSEEKNQEYFLKVKKDKLDRKDYDFRGTVFPDGTSDFRSFEFDANANFNGATFVGEADFTGAQFSGRVTSFSGAQFSGKWTGFSRAQFRSDALTTFSRAQFRSGNRTYFKQAHFISKCTEFSRAHFRSERTTFSGARFCGALTTFRGAQFHSERTSFRDTTFTRKVDFSRATFTERVPFWVTPEEKKKDNHIFGPQAWAWFDLCRIDKPELLEFNSVRLHPGWFINADVRKVNFTNVEWYGMPGGIEGTLDKEIDALTKGAPDMCPDNPPSYESPHTLLAQACRRLSANMEENREYPLANEFHYWSMDALRKGSWSRFQGLSRRGLTKIETWRDIGEHFGLITTLYWALSGYGVRAARALWVLMGMWAMFTFLYVLADPSEFKDFGQGIGYRWQAAVYSLLAMARLNPEPRPDEPGLFQFLVGLEGILGPLQIALLALAIRRQVMR